MVSDLNLNAKVNKMKSAMKQKMTQVERHSEMPESFDNISRKMKGMSLQDQFIRDPLKETLNLVQKPQAYEMNYKMNDVNFLQEVN